MLNQSSAGSRCDKATMCHNNSGAGAFTRNQHTSPSSNNSTWCFCLLILATLLLCLIIVVLTHSPNQSRHLVVNTENKTINRVEFIDSTILNNVSSIVRGIYWSDNVESLLPTGYTLQNNAKWQNYVNSSARAVRVQIGCGRMQNRLITFADGSAACVRYRQNQDQIQGELFSFYLAQILNLRNLAPSTVNVIKYDAPLWNRVHDGIQNAQWMQNRPVVLTQFISGLDVGRIPSEFKRTEQHLNRNDLLNLTLQNNRDKLIELAQWSDLIIFDYLTANLDRIVNNLYNYQWNENIMEAPAHNLAKQRDNNLLLFLDNESGLLHGYRLLAKYEIYHTILLDNLCVFRKSTAEAIVRLKRAGNVGDLLRAMFERLNDVTVKETLPTLPDKSIKILKKRIERVYEQLIKCEMLYGSDDDHV